MDDDDVRRVGGQDWPRRHWPDDADPDWGDLQDDLGQAHSDGEVEWDAHLEHDWYEDAAHAFDHDHPRHREHP